MWRKCQYMPFDFKNIDTKHKMGDRDQTMFHFYWKRYWETSLEKTIASHQKPNNLLKYLSFPWIYIFYTVRILHLICILPRVYKYFLWICIGFQYFVNIRKHSHKILFQEIVYFRRQMSLLFKKILCFSKNFKGTIKKCIFCSCFFFILYKVYMMILYCNIISYRRFIDINSCILMRTIFVKYLSLVLYVA